MNGTGNTRPPLRRSLALGLRSGCVALCLMAGQAFAWGSSGHRMVTVTAVQSLPPELPGFLRDPVTAADAGEWARGAGSLATGGRRP